MAAFRCVALTEAFRRARGAAGFARARACLDRAPAEGGEDATLLGHKALLLAHAIPALGLMDADALDGPPPTAAEALDTARRAIALDPGAEVAQAVHGVPLLASGERGAALASLRRAAEASPSGPAVQAALGLAWASVERWKEARAARARWR